MPLYYFHVRGCLAEVGAGDGLDFPDDGAAREAAIAGARGMIAEDVVHGILNLDCHIDVTDEQGSILFTVPFASAIERA